MPQPKLFRYLEKFSKEDWRLFGRYIKGSFREGHEVLKLYDNLRDLKDRVVTHSLQLDDIQKRMESRSSRKTLQNLLSMLSAEVEKYWVWSDLHEQDQRMNMFKVESLNRRNLYQESEKYLESVCKEKDALHPWSGYHVARSFFTVLFSNHSLKSDSAKLTRLVERTTQSLVKWHNIMIQWLLAEFYNREFLLSEDLNDYISTLENALIPFQKDDFGKISQEQLLLVKSNYDKEPVLIRKMLFDGKINDSLTKHILYFRLREYWIRRARKGDKSDVGMLVKLINWSTSNEALIVHNEVAYKQYISDLNVLCTVASESDVDEFIKKYSDKVPKSVRVDIGLFSTLTKYYAFKQYDELIKQYLTSSFKLPILRIQALGYFLRASYDLYGSDSNYFYYHIVNANSFLRRNKQRLKKTQYMGWRNFLKVFHQMASKRKKEKIMLDISKHDLLVHRQWINARLIDYPY